MLLIYIHREHISYARINPLNLSIRLGMIRSCEEVLDTIILGEVSDERGSEVGSIVGDEDGWSTMSAINLFYKLGRILR